MKPPRIESHLFSKAFSELPVPAVVFFKKRGVKPLANAAARQLFGVQLTPLTKNLFTYVAGGKPRPYPVKELPWHIALSRGIGAQKDDMVMQRGKNDHAVLLLLPRWWLWPGCWLCGCCVMQGLPSGRHC